jgi:hypothetical protein
MRIAIAVAFCLSLAQDDPYAVAKKLKEKLAAAKTIRIQGECAAGGRQFTMDVRIKGTKFEARAKGFPGVDGDFVIMSDGRALVVENAPDRGGDALEDYPVARFTSFTHPIVLGMLGQRGAGRDLSLEDVFLKPGGGEKVGERDCVKLEYALITGRRGDTIRGTTWIDAKTGLPVKQEATLGREKLSETYVITLDEEMPDSIFALQSKRRLTEALLRQVAKAVELYQNFQGLAPSSLAALTKRPEADAFWPEGGFWLGGSLKDGWGRDLVYEAGEVVSHGADGKAGGSGDDADLRLAVAPVSGWRIRPPTDRLRQVYATRVHLQLLSGAIEAFRYSTRSAPANLDELMKRPANVEAWPEGGFIASVPVDPAGKAYSFDKGLLRCVGVARIKVNKLTPEEHKALEAAAAVPLTAAEQEAVASQLGRLGSEDLDVREEASKALLRVGPRLIAVLEKRLASEKDAEAKARLREIRAKIVEVRPTWQTELGGRLAAGSSGPKTDTACMNNLAQLWKMQHNYMVNFGGAMKEMPKATGPEFWLALVKTTPPLIDNTLKDIFLCPGSGETDGCTYWGPGSDVNKFEDGDPVGMCDDPCHVDKTIILRKSGDVMIVGQTDPLYVKACEKLKAPEEK